MISMIPLSQLRLSDLNVRKTERDVDIVNLASDIAARGLKQNLVVVKTPEHKAKAPDYEVVAGGRRFQALQMLDAEGRLLEGYQVPCIIDERDQGVETSLSENLHRVAMNPADEFTAFRTIIDAAVGTDNERLALCAKRFGVTEAHVKGRLRLASLSETILEALRAGAITLGAAMAYAAVNDQALQDKVFAAQAKSGWKPHDPDRIRNAMREKTYSTQDRRVMFAGLDEYAKRGGRLDTDLFTTDAGERLLDTGLMDELVKEKFETVSAKFAKKHGFDSVIFVGNSYDQKAPKDYSSFYAGTDKARVAENVKKVRAEHGTVIGSAYLETDGKLAVGSYAYVPEAPKAEGEGDAKNSGQEVDWDERRRIEARDRHIKLEAFRLAFPSVKDTPFSGRMWWPQALGFARINEDRDDGNIMLEVQISVTREEFEAQLEAALPIYEAAVSAKAEADAAEAVAKEAAEAAYQAELARLVENPPAVVALHRFRETSIFYRWADGTYFDTPEDDEDAEADQGYETVEEMAEAGHLVNYWASMEAYLADQSDDEEEQQAA